MANQEGKILLTLDDIKSGRIKSLRAASRLYEISSTTLHGSSNGLVYLHASIAAQLVMN